MLELGCGSARVVSGLPNPSVSDAIADNTAQQVAIYFSIPVLSNPVGMYIELKIF